MNELIDSSFRFHADLEGFRNFIRREWPMLALCAGAYATLMLTILLSIDTAFFYPRIETDQLLYLLKAKSLVETGSTAARGAVNVDPFEYAAMPGVLRAPFLFFFDEFDNQLRGIQMLNVAIVAAAATMSAYILSWALPRKLHPGAIAFAFAFVVLSPDWLTNTFVPLADAPYALLTLSCLLIATSVLTSERPVSSQWGAVTLFAVLFVIAFLVRFTAPVVLVAVAVLARGRRSDTTIAKTTKRIIIGVTLMLLLILVVFNAQAIFGKYIGEPFWFLFMADKTGMGLNVFGSAIPTQIIPVFNLAFEVMPPANVRNPVFGTTTRDSLWTAVGLLISGIAAIGLARSTKRILPETACFLVVLPILGVMIPGTTRYLMSYQAVLWFMFATGAAFLIQPWTGRVSSRHVRIFTVTVALLGVAGIVFVRSATAARTADAESMLDGPRRYTREVSATFRGLRSFLESLPRERTLLISSGGEVGRWEVIADRAHYVPDSLLAAIISAKDVYSIISCGTPAACAPFDDWHSERARRLTQYGDFKYEKVFEHRTASARATVHRLSIATAMQDTLPAYSASGRTDR